MQQKIKLKNGWYEIAKWERVQRCYTKTLERGFGKRKNEYTKYCK